VLPRSLGSHRATSTWKYLLLGSSSSDGVAISPTGSSGARNVGLCPNILISTSLLPDGIKSRDISNGTMTSFRRGAILMSSAPPSKFSTANVTCEV